MYFVTFVMCAWQKDCTVTCRQFPGDLPSTFVLHSSLKVIYKNADFNTTDKKYKLFLYMSFQPKYYLCDIAFDPYCLGFDG